ncbi:MAG: phosphoribosylformylglycinamidine synthase subunit PurQ [Armatimonadetes bacterium]|nr:phosphoribosylformylglycinamidine synthase subunit PurQ [Armatimonadota bacterium]MDE2206381.1 phosphoribosylformylglycinamidine synthase subunit PurQ [Armatimonadota bacterium]
MTLAATRDVHVGVGRRPRFAVIRFPGSNCDQDAVYAVKRTTQCEATYVWHATADLDGFDVVILPGGFSYGDYLRPGSIARFANVMDAVRQHAERGRYVLGICNGFQVLCEAGLLPGALVANIGCKFLCRPVTLRVENANTPFTHTYREGQTLSIPIAHGEGRYYCDAATLERLQRHHQIIFRYAAETDEYAPANPNGSLDCIAGIVNEGGNVLGMMPHPERATDIFLGSADGRLIFQALASAFCGAPTEPGH